MDLLMYYTDITIGMPHLLANKELNLNHFVKLTGDAHWRIQNDNPSKLFVDGKRVYNSFLYTDIQLNDTINEDDQFVMTTTGEQIDDYIFCSTHTFKNSTIKMYTVGIHVEDHKVLRVDKTGGKRDVFWDNHRKQKLGINTVDALEQYETSYLVDFNSAGILYCANYITFAYRYMDKHGFFKRISDIYYFGNINPGEKIFIGQDEFQDLIMYSEDMKPICKFNGNNL